MANVEKTIFLAPDAITVPRGHPNLDDLYLEPLSPEHASLRLSLNRTFPTEEQPKGPGYWFLLDGLTPQKRYEVRVCWIATQPTAFHIETHTLSAALETPELISSLTMFAYAREGDLSELEIQYLASKRSKLAPGKTKESLLFLRVFAAADYFSPKEGLMKNPPPVLVDIILDPYVFNVFPRSLVPTAGYIGVLAVGSWFLAKLIAKWLGNFIRSADDDNNGEKTE